MDDITTEAKDHFLNDSLEDFKLLFGEMEDQFDIMEADKSMKEAEEKGTVPFREVMKELGLKM